jgi:hypothetical protein
VEKELTEDIIMTSNTGDPASINYIRFGVRIDVGPVVGQGDVTVFYDLVELTVEYSLE